MGGSLGSILVSTAVYGLLALGFVMIYRSTRVLQFAHGQVFVVGGYLGGSLVAAMGVPGVVAFPLTALIGFALGWLAYHGIIRKMAGRPLFAVALVTIAVGLGLQGLMLLLWTARIRYPARDLGLKVISYELSRSLTLTNFEIMLLTTFLVVLLGLVAFFRFSTLGIQMRAASQDAQLGAYRAINIHRLFGFVWGIAVATAMFAGLTYSVNFRLEPGLSALGFKGFAAAMAGGMDSLEGAALGALIVATAEALAHTYVSPLFSEVVAFVILFIVVLVRPWGLLGTKELIDRV